MTAARSMKVVHLINGLGRGGGERLLADLVLGLPAEVHSEVYCLTRLGPVADELVARGVSVRALTREGLPRPTDCVALAAAAARADLVHTHFFYSDAMGALGRALHVARRVVSTRHETGYWMGRTHRQAERLVLSRLDAVLCVSEAVRRSLLERGAPADRLEVVRPGISLPSTDAPPSRARVIVSVGRLEWVKGHDVLITAFARSGLVAQGWSLEIVGEGAERSTLERLAAALEVPVRFAGALDPAGVDERLRAAGLFCLPSRSEGLPLSLMEAMARGLPCVAADAGGVRELVEAEVTGWLVPPADVPALAAALCVAAEDSSARERVGQRARLAARERFGVEHFVGGVLAMYHRLARS